MAISHLLGHVTITSFRDKYLYETEQLIRQHPYIFSTDDMKQFRQDLLAYLNDHRLIGDKARIVILQANGKVGGCVVFFKEPGSHDYYKIEWLILAKDMLHMGYGTLLFKYAEHLMKEGHAKHVYVATSHESRNDEAIKFYESRGMKEMGTLPNFYTNPLRGRKTPEDKVIFWKHL